MGVQLSAAAKVSAMTHTTTPPAPHRSRRDSVSRGPSAAGSAAASSASTSPTPSSQLKTQGYLDGAARFGLEPLVVRGVTGSRDGGYAAMQRLLQAHPEVDGVACSLDIVACGALRAIQDSGRRVPQDIAVVGTDNSIYCEICNPTLTSLDTMVFNSGVMIAHQLVDCLEGKGANRRTMLFTGIVRRESA